jgi:hypothetical protein
MTFTAKEIIFVIVCICYGVTFLFNIFICIFDEDYSSPSEEEEEMVILVLGLNIVNFFAIQFSLSNFYANIALIILYGLCVLICIIRDEVGFFSYVVLVCFALAVLGMIIIYVVQNKSEALFLFQTIWLSIKYLIFITAGISVFCFFCLRYNYEEMGVIALISLVISGAFAVRTFGWSLPLIVLFNLSLLGGIISFIKYKINQPDKYEFLPRFYISLICCFCVLLSLGYIHKDILPLITPTKQRQLNIKLYKLQALHKTINDKRIEIDQSIVELKNENNSLKQKVRKVKSRDNINSFSQAQNSKTISDLLYLIRRNDGYIKKMQKVNIEIRLAGEEVENMISATKSDLKVSKILKEKDINSIVIQIDDILAKYGQQYDNFVIRIENSDLKSLNQVWREITEDD